MAEEQTTEEENKAPDESKKKKKKIIIAAVIALIILLAGGYFLKSGSNSSAKENSHQENKTANLVKPHDVFYDLEDFMVNLASSDSRPRFLKLTLTISISSNVDTSLIAKKLPIIRDSFQVYLRELRPADLQGSQATYILKEELLLRINKILFPIVVQDILFRDILVN